MTMSDIVALSPWVVGAFGVLALAGASIWVARAESERRRVSKRLATLRKELSRATGEPENASARVDWSRRLLERLAKEHVELQRLRQAGGGPSLADPASLVQLAAAALREAADLARRGGGQGDAAQFVEAFALAAEIERALALVSGLRLGEQPSALEDALRAGDLGAIFSASAALSAYFATDRYLAPLDAALRIAVAALAGALAARDVIVVVARPLTVASGGGLSLDRIDRRELRRVATIRALANRAADRLARGEELIVDCSGLGWRSTNGDRPPDAVCWDRGSWLN